MWENTNKKFACVVFDHAVICKVNLVSLSVVLKELSF